jgi:transcriptional regulator GlxA family with amidase domain
VDDSEIITAGGVTSGVDFGLCLVQRLASAEMARKTRNPLEHERRGPAWAWLERFGA